MTTILKSVYLAHPYSTKEYGVKLAKKIEALGIHVADPFNRPAQQELNKVEDANRAGIPTEFTYAQSKDIVVSDLRRVRQADAVVAIVNGDDSKGTHMEAISAAHFYDMPLFTLYTQSGRVHPWYIYLSRFVVKTEAELLAVLKDWAKMPK